MQEQDPDARKGAEGGYALVEVIVAFAILSITLIGLYRAAGERARNAQYVGAKVEALAIAQSLLASVGHDLPLNAGTQQGEALGGGYSWTIDISPYLPARSSDPNPVEGYWVEATVTAPASAPAHAPLIVLRTLKLRRSQ